MKTYRPYCAGYLLLYGLVLLSVADAVYTLVGQITGTANAAMSSFSLFSYIICILALFFVKIYIRAKVVIDEKQMRVAFPVSLRPREGQRRAMFIYRQGDTDLRLVDKTIPLDKITRYGYVEDLGYERLDASGATEKNKLFPVHEVAIITSDNKRYHMNAAIYSATQQKDMFSRLMEATGVAPEGRLAQVLK